MPISDAARANHELLFPGHVSTLAVTMVGVVALLADIGVRGLLFGGRNRNNNDGGNIVYLALMALALVLLVLSPIIARLMQFAVSRRRESLADISLPSRHRLDIRLHRRVAIALRDLRVAARQKTRRRRWGSPPCFLR